MNIAFFCTGNGSFFRFIYQNRNLLEKVENILLFSDKECGVMSDFRDYPNAKIFYAADFREFESLVLKWLLANAVDFVFLSCNKILRYDLLEHFGEEKKQMFNCHPSLLPRYVGLDSVKRSFVGDDRLYGATIHYVTKEVDKGGIVARCVLKRCDSNLRDYTHRLFVHQALLYLDFVLKVSLGEGIRVLEDFNEESSLGFMPSLTLDYKSVKFFNALDYKLLKGKQ
ncbi:formyltransferase family protein [Helicobacter mesocricetorum]|uniref:formyltransferase family protein n=1 Tax=Helicobacter mesocricetorum TaxID=87012 RepID=UPI000CF0299E|nr:formyltransferase family protein [Helicobacter mesocricetorum]